MYKSHQDDTVILEALHRAALIQDDLSFKDENFCVRKHVFCEWCSGRAFSVKLTGFDVLNPNN